MLSGTLQQLMPSINMLHSFVTWTSLDSTLRGEDPSVAILEIDSQSPKSSGAALAAAAARGRSFSPPMHTIHRPTSSARDAIREELKEEAQPKDVGLPKQVIYQTLLDRGSYQTEGQRVLSDRGSVQPGAALSFFD